MSDTTPSPADKAQLDKITNVLTALVEETRQSKVMISDVIAQRTQYAADIKDLKASVDTTRRALDPEALAKHVADNTTAFMGETTSTFARALKASTQLDKDLRFTNKALEAQTSKLAAETTLLRGLAERLEDAAQRSKWDWASLAAAMVMAALLAGAGAYYAAKAQIERNDFNRSVQLIAQDDRGGRRISDQLLSSGD